MTQGDRVGITISHRRQDSVPNFRSRRPRTETPPIACGLIKWTPGTKRCNLPHGGATLIGFRNLPSARVCKVSKLFAGHDSPTNTRIAHLTISPSFLCSIFAGLPVSFHAFLFYFCWATSIIFMYFSRPSHQRAI